MPPIVVLIISVAVSLLIAVAPILLIGLINKMRKR